MSRKKARLYKAAKSSKDPKKMKRFKEYQKTVKKECRKAHTEYINNYVVSGIKAGNTKPFYRYIKSLKNDSLGLAPLKAGTALLTSASQKCEALLEEFSSVFTVEITDAIPWLGPAQHKMEDIVVVQDGVQKLLSQLQPHKAAGPDRISNRVLKELAYELAPILTKIFNQSLSTGTIPDDWSKAMISPVFKKGSVHLPSNYRPVSLTVCSCKLLEHIICTNIHSHLQKHNLLTPVQHGFRKAHSCESQLLSTMDDFYAAYDSKVQTDVGVLDFSRAFDTVPHQRLFGKIASFGIQGTTLKWIEAFLTNRTMQVVIDGCTSKTAPVTSGVPQGTVLGPLLFNLYINDMPQEISEESSLKLFADDCLVYREIHTSEDQQALQKDLHNLQAWAARWGMRFNPDKCNIMHIHPKRTKPVTKLYEMCNQILQTVQSAKYLGVIIKDDLTWHEQICAATKKANSTLHLVARNLRRCPRATRELAYTTLVRPKVEYCASVWDPHQKEDINTLEMLNRRAARTVYNKSWRQRDVSPTELLNTLGWSTLQQRRKQQRLCMMYRITNGLIAVPTIRLQRPARTTRGHSWKYQTLRSSCDVVKFSFFVRTILDWNSLPNTVVSKESLSSFKRELETHFTA